MPFVIFTQGDAADSVFYIQTGKVKLTVVSKIGKEAPPESSSDGPSSKSGRCPCTNYP